MSARILVSDEDENYEKMLSLKEGDKIYTTEVEHDGNKNETTVKVRELEFIKYEDAPSKIESLENKYSVGDPIMATLRDPKFPKINIEHQDIGVGYFLTPEASLDSNIETLKIIMTAIEKEKTKYGKK